MSALTEHAGSTTWPARAIVQEALAQITWYHNVTLIEKLEVEADRLLYGRQMMEHGWSRRGLGYGI